MQPTAILEAAIYASDLVAAENFYSRMLGLALIGKVPGRHLFYRVGPVVLLIFDPSATETASPNASIRFPTHGARGPGHVCFAAGREEIDHWRAHLTGAGVAIDIEFDWPNGARSLYVRDPAGSSVEFAEPRL